jgi:glycine/D-amino acid oxidase-like deaminating enzyme
MKKADYIIVGQGLAGTLLAHFLEKKGKKVLLIDPGEEGTATKVAAGIINPITGRRYVKSWRVDELIPFAEDTYRSIEAILDVSIFHSRPIIRTLFNAREENDWMLRTGDPAYRPYMLDKADLGNYEAHTVKAFSYGEVQHSAQVDIGWMTRAYRDFFIKNGQLLEETLDYKQITFQNGKVQYGDIEAQGLIFCEGAKATSNPFFDYLPFGGAKGEVLIIKIKDTHFDKILKHRIFIVPLNDGTYWIGSTYNWKFEDKQPTSQGREYLQERLKDVLKVPFEIVQHKAAVRPTVKDRRPFLGRHPEFTQLAIFNGLGTKGASLGPFWAKHMADHLISGSHLDKEVDIQRFDK